MQGLVYLDRTANCLINIGSDNIFNYVNGALAIHVVGHNSLTQNHGKILDLRSSYWWHRKMMLKSGNRPLRFNLSVWYRQLILSNLSCITTDPLWCNLFRPGPWLVSVSFAHFADWKSHTRVPLLNVFHVCTCPGLTRNTSGVLFSFGVLSTDYC